MKKAVVALCCLTAAMLFLPSQLPAPVDVQLTVAKICLVDAANQYRVTITNPNGFDVFVTAIDDNGTPSDPSDDLALYSEEFLLAFQSLTTDYGDSGVCSSAQNTITATARYTVYTSLPVKASAVCECEEQGGCRVTGGGNATAGAGMDGLWDGTFAADKLRLGQGEYDRYTFGGQAGARTALPPQPWGEWTHHQMSGADGDFVFHAGTASAPPGTEIATIICRDETGPCMPAPAGGSPFKQINFDGVGTLKNIKDAPAFQGDAPGEKYYFFQVYIEDNGEPGGQGNKNGGVNCPAMGRGDAFANPEILGTSDCQCADFYRIRIFGGVVPQFDAAGALTNLAEMKSQPVIYQVYGYIDGGNLQIHPLTGFDR